MSGTLAWWTFIELIRCTAYILIPIRSFFFYKIFFIWLFYQFCQRIVTPLIRGTGILSDQTMSPGWVHTKKATGLHVSFEAVSEYDRDACAESVILYSLTATAVWRGHSGVRTHDSCVPDATAQNTVVHQQVVVNVSHDDKETTVTKCPETVTSQQLAR